MRVRHAVFMYLVYVYTRVTRLFVVCLFWEKSNNLCGGGVRTMSLIRGVIK